MRALAVPSHIEDLHLYMTGNLIPPMVHTSITDARTENLLSCLQSQTVVIKRLSSGLAYVVQTKSSKQQLSLTDDILGSSGLGDQMNQASHCKRDPARSGSYGNRWKFDVVMPGILLASASHTILLSRILLFDISNS